MGIQTTPPTLSNTSPIAKPDSRAASPAKSQLSPKNVKSGVPKVIKLVNGKSLPPGLVPCAPPPGTKLIPCSPPNRTPPIIPKKSLFDIEETETDILDRV